MATLLELYSLYQPNGDLYARFEAAFVSAAWDVINEDPGTTNHTNRIALAKQILLEPAVFTKKYYRLFMSNATIQTNMDTSTDNDVQSVVNSFLDQIANAEA